MYKKRHNKYARKDNLLHNNKQSLAKRVIELVWITFLLVVLYAEFWVIG